jgi:hypothetical protein
MNAKLNKRERRAAQLLAHYATCERLARYLGATSPDGKKISVSLFKLEREANAAATAQCNGEAYNGQPFRTSWNAAGEDDENSEWDQYCKTVGERVALALGVTHKHVPPAFHYNTDPRGYALKIDNEKPEGRALIEAGKLRTDWGGYGILSPEITGDN